MSKTYRVQEFSELTGVTVRALHHYDRLSLLRPRRTDAGYRMYSGADLERLERIVALKFLGLPLKQIKTVLDRDTRAFPEVLHAQRQALEDKRRRLDLAIGAIRDAEEGSNGGTPDAALVRRIIEVIEMEDNREYLKQFYDEGSWAELERRRAEMTPEMRQKAEDGTRRWMELFRDIEGALDQDPASPAAQALGARWKGLVEEFTQGHQGISSGLGKVWANREAWPGPMQKQAGPFMDPRVWDYMKRVLAAGSH